MPLPIPRNCSRAGNLPFPARIVRNPHPARIPPLGPDRCGTHFGPPQLVPHADVRLPVEAAIRLAIDREGRQAAREHVIPAKAVCGRRPPELSRGRAARRTSRSSSRRVIAQPATPPSLQRQAEHGSVGAVVSPAGEALLIASPAELRLIERSAVPSLRFGCQPRREGDRPDRRVAFPAHVRTGRTAPPIALCVHDRAGVAVGARSIADKRVARRRCDSSLAAAGLRDEKPVLECSNTLLASVAVSSPYP
jgi:hypothetical protein